MQSVTRLLVGALLGLLVALSGGAAAAATEVPDPMIVAGLEQPTTTAQQPTAPPGPALTPEQESAKSRQKLVVGITAVVLLTIVVLGRSARNKSRKKAEAGKSG